MCVHIYVYISRSVFLGVCFVSVFSCVFVCICAFVHVGCVCMKYICTTFVFASVSFCVLGWTDGCVSVCGAFVVRKDRHGDALGEFERGDKSAPAVDGLEGLSRAEIEMLRKVGALDGMLGS